MLVVLKWVLYLLALGGLWGLISPLLRPQLRRTRERVRLLTKLGKERLTSSRMFHHLDQMLYLVQKKYEPGVSVYRFFSFSGFWFAATFFTAFFFTSQLPMTLATSNPFLPSSERVGDVRLGMTFSVFVAIIAAFIPYLALQIRYLTRKVKAGYDLLAVVKTMPRFTHLALDTALQKTAEVLPEGNVLKKPLKLFVFTLSGHTFPEELRREGERLIQIIDTTFGVVFVTNILYAYRTGGHVEDFLFRLQESMEDQLIAVQNAKKDVGDAIAMGAYGNVVAVIGVAFGLGYMLGWSIYLRLQFQTVVGVQMFGMVLVTTLASLIVSLLLSRPKLDYK
jgi:hypothetical protein